MAARAILESRGSAARLYRNALVFLAADRNRLQDLDEAIRKHLAWISILAEQTQLNLDPQQVAQADSQRKLANDAVMARIPETYQWLLVPIQPSPHASVEWQAHKLGGQDGLAVRASKKLKNDELLLTAFAGTRLRMELDRVPLWRGKHVAIRQLVEDFGSYLYLPRLKDSSVLTAAIRGGIGLLTWETEGFAFADGFDEATGRYRGLVTGQPVSIDADSTGLLVKSDVARLQLDADRAASSGHTGGGADQPGVASGGKAVGGTGSGTSGPMGSPGSTTSSTPPHAAQPRRFHGSINLDATRVGRDAGRIAEEVISHLAGLVGAEVTVTLEIDASIPGGAPEHVVRTVTENSRTLNFTVGSGFEKE